ncbi:MAG: potassium-transporting ATPase subunit KdpC [Longicatena sp.]
MKKYLKTLRSACFFSIGMLLLCGLVYPLALTTFSQVLFHDKANGSIIRANGKAIGSSMVGQDFSDARLFKCRPSAYHYNTYTKQEKEEGTYAGIASGSNNYAPTNPELAKRVEKDIEAFLKANPKINKSEIPTDLLSASSSGLDPHISLASASVQVSAIAQASGLSEAKLNAIIKSNTSEKLLGIFGETTVNVLGCNLEIAKLIGLIK